MKLSSMLILLGRRHALFSFATLPAMLKTVLYGTDLTGIQRYWATSWDSSGYQMVLYI